MPRISLSTDCLLETSYRTLDSSTNRFNRYYKIPSLITSVSDDEELSTLSPNEIDEILSRKLYEQLKTVSREEKEQKSEFSVDSELIILIDRFFNLTYQNTLPMVNLLATAVATNFLQENIRELDNKLQEQQGTSLLHELEDDDNLSWTSAPT